jgi:hypothetical protein
MAWPHKLSAWFDLDMLGSARSKAVSYCARNPNAMVKQYSAGSMTRYHAVEISSDYMQAEQSSRGSVANIAAGKKGKLLLVEGTQSAMLAHRAELPR